MEKNELVPINIHVSSSRVMNEAYCEDSPSVQSDKNQL